MRFTIDRAVVGERRSASQRAKSRRSACEAVALRSSRAGARNAGTPGRHFLAGAEKVAAVEAMRLRAAASRSISTSCVVLRMTLPQGLDPPILLLPFGNRRSPVAEHGGGLLGRSSSRGTCEDRAHVRGHRIGHRILGRGHGEAEAAQVVVLVVVAVPAAVVLHELEREPHAGRSFERLLEYEHRLARHIAAAGADVDAPRRLVVAVDGKLDRSGHAPLPLRSSKALSTRALADSRRPWPSRSSA